MDLTAIVFRDKHLVIGSLAFDVVGSEQPTALDARGRLGSSIYFFAAVSCRRADNHLLLVEVRLDLRQCVPVVRQQLGYHDWRLLVRALCHVCTRHFDLFYYELFGLLLTIVVFHFYFYFIMQNVGKCLPKNCSQMKQCLIPELIYADYTFYLESTAEPRGKRQLLV